MGKKQKYGGKKYRGENQGKEGKNVEKNIKKRRETYRGKPRKQKRGEENKLWIRNQENNTVEVKNQGNKNIARKHMEKKNMEEKSMKE
ncbi:hypothetical protein CEXT_685861 [Caerostris extrusa]|uniref:Uncharacterized protein n=1 Tax=Caerostris extrusa TaxID=172846 RepID=A0AAV4Q6F2_CAEEX|nr:hypothetical protein CEXT_685861 [Caerostris extrusa]